MPLAWQHKACGRHGTGLEVETDLWPFVHSVKTRRTADGLRDSTLVR